MRTMEKAKTIDNVWHEINANNATCSECGSTLYGTHWYNMFYGLYVCQMCVSAINSKNLSKYN